jgi:diadenosine hexaphosphate hydrolase (ATP-forming)
LILFQIGTDGAERWVFPKGHIEPGESAETTALRELAEEAGIAMQATERALNPTSFVYEDAQGVISKTVAWFLVQCDPSTIATPNVAEGFHQARWVTLAEGLSLLTYDSDRGLLQSATEEAP